MEKIKPNHQCLTVPNVQQERKRKIQAKYEEKTQKKTEISKNYTNYLMKLTFQWRWMKKTEGHFICKRCGLYATREEVSDIRFRLNQKEKTEDKHDDYLDWWSKSKKEKARKLE